MYCIYNHTFQYTFVCRMTETATVWWPRCSMEQSEIGCTPPVLWFHIDLLNLRDRM